MDLRFIVTGHGRSGTKWLARLLNDATTDVIVHHEPLVQFDAAHYARVYSGALDPREFVAERERRMQAIWARFPNRGYAEVNGYLRIAEARIGKALEEARAELAQPQQLGLEER